MPGPLSCRAAVPVCRERRASSVTAVNMQQLGVQGCELTDSTSSYIYISHTDRRPDTTQTYRVEPSKPSDIYINNIMLINKVAAIISEGKGVLSEYVRVCQSMLKSAHSNAAVLPVMGEPRPAFT